MMEARHAGVRPPPPLELWGGVECTVNRVGDRWFDQLAWSGHDRRPDDVARCAALGMRTMRYPILWERLTANGGDEIDWRWSDDRLGRLRDHGVRVIAGLLHHGSGPAGTSLLDPRFPERLARVAAAVARRYPWLLDFTPVNEPLTTARFSALYGHWYPHARSDGAFVRALLNQVRGSMCAMRAIRDVTPGARLIQTEDCGRSYGTDETRHQVAHENDRRWLTWDLLTGRVDDRHPLHAFLIAGGMTDEDEAFFRSTDCAPDVLGLNYYLTSDRFLDHRLERYPAAVHGGNGYMRYADVEAVRARTEGVAGHEAHLVAAWRRYHIPLALTEVHLGCSRDEQMRWLLESWDGAQRARARGVDVRAVTAWAIFGSYNWNSLVTRDSQHYEPGAFDVRGAAPRPTALAAMTAALAAGETPAHPVLAGVPWWKRPQRLAYGAAPSQVEAPATGPPLLIVGAAGTLGRAFERVCDSRGLAFRLVGRREVDITDPARVDDVIRRVRPWAVINAAGYVRVDEAERDAEGCRRANVTGPMNLAAACRRHGLPLVTYSSDLVFDGTAGRGYVEQDTPRPLNVYGRSKADAERLVLDLLPDALVIRTSAFFGPWDDYNFLTCMFRTVHERVPFRCPDDTTVSPTYVPDLVHASLDLLIDGEHGIWHLANEGAVTWYDFARMAIAETDARSAFIVPAHTAAVWGPAERPRYVPLASQRGQQLRPLADALAAYLAAAPDPQAAVEAATGTDG